MFTQQYTRQLSTSPPPIVYSGYQTDAMYPPYTTDMSYPPLPSSNSDMPIFPAELPPLASSIPTTLSMTNMDFPPKHDAFFAPEMSPYNFSYASMSNIDINAAQSYSDSNPSHVGPPFSYRCAA